ncbi:MAG TPA: hypothetical protein VFE68_04580, partial [Vicinamibacteria bacterium]|nr:hypothetical protein [Vicinamibacteria bacterium]
MGPRLDVARRAVALATAISFALSPAAPLVAAPAQAPAAPPAVGPPAPKPTAAQKAAAASPAPATPAVTPPDGGWPRAYATPSGGKIIVYQPQIASWEGQKQMTAYAAVSYEAKGAPKPALGSVKLEASTKVSVAERLVSFKDLRITESNFPTLPKEQTRDVVAEVDKSIPDQERVIALDRVLASVDRSQIIPKEVPGVKADPPVIFSSQTPAVLVNIDGEPIWSPIKENDLKYAVNTNWDLFLHDPTKTYYLRKEGVFLKAADLKGPWGPAGQLPGSFAKLPADDNWKEVKAVLPGKKIDAKQAPRVFVSTVPAEMILIEGKPAYQQVVGTSLYWVGNSDSDLFRVGQTGPVYFLVAGRWFSSPGFEGPWTFATPTLPADFQKIPLEHPRSRVLASVPGTAQAAEAVLLAQVPQTARVNKKQTKAPEVAYAGEPKFEKVEKTKVERAVNTDKSIIKVGDMYYMCYEGVWFMGSSPTGPWTVASKVPGEIYEIPISSPVHNVTYVTVEDDDDDEWATFATAAMYTGVMVAWGCAVWGSGWYYPPYYGGFYGGYPYYRGYYPTYGYRASYNPWTGAYSRGVSAYGPYGGAGVSARYNPRTGTYSRGAAAYGPYGSRAAGSAYNPRTGAYGATRQGSNVYGSWGATSVQRGDQWATTARATNNMTGTTTRATRTSGGGAAVSRTGPAGGTVARTGSGDVYAGRDGNVYRQSGGSWQKYDNGNWGSVDRPAPTTRSAGAGTTSSSTVGPPARAGSGTMDQLNRDSYYRSEGAQRTRDYGSYQRSGSGSSSYRS